MEKTIETGIKEITDMFMRFQPRCQLQFQVDLTDHCNLNCRSCSAYSPLAEKKFLDVDSYRSDCERLSELFHKEAKRIILQGGEPLLHPQITEIMRITREAFPVGIIQIITNGILLPSMQDDFWETCKACRIQLTPTEYPIHVDYGMCSDLAREKGVTYIPESFGIDKSSPFKFGRHLLSLEYIGSPEHNFAKCDSANRCITLRQGRMYTCMVATTVIRLKKYFNLDIPLSDQNGIDIYAVKDGEELMRKLARAIPLCGHCDPSRTTYLEDWGISKKSRYEWLGFEFLEEDFQYLKNASSVYVFGTSAFGMETIRRLQREDISVTAVLATRTEGKESHILGVPLVNLQEIKPEGENSVCLLASHNLETRRELYPVLQSCGFGNVLPVYGLNRTE